MGSATTINGSTLDSLGSCFAAYVPSMYLSQLSATDFYSRISVFKSAAFQPNSTIADVIKSKLSAVYATLTSQSDIQTFINNIGQLVVFLSEINQVPSVCLKQIYIYFYLFFLKFLYEVTDPLLLCFQKFYNFTFINK